MQNDSVFEELKVVQCVMYGGAIPQNLDPILWAIWSQFESRKRARERRNMQQCQMKYVFLKQNSVSSGVLPGLPYLGKAGDICALPLSPWALAKLSSPTSDYTRVIS